MRATWRAVAASDGERENLGQRTTSLDLVVGEVVDQLINRS